MYNSIVKNTKYQVQEDGTVTVKTNGNQDAFTITGLGSGSSVVIGDGLDDAESQHWVDLVWNGAASDSSVTRGTNSTAYGYQANASEEGAVALGYNAKASAANSVALGSGSVADAENVVSVGGGDIATRKIVNVADGESNSDAATFGQIAKKNQTVTLVSGGTANKIVNNNGDIIATVKITDGKVASGDKGYVTGGTLYTEGRVTGSNYNAIDKGNSVAKNLEALDAALSDSSIVVGDEEARSLDISWNEEIAAANGRGTNSAAYGYEASASGNDSVALGYQAKASEANSVALGAGSVADVENVVSVGSSDLTRRIINVADGTENTDAATYGQIAKKNQTVTLVSGGTANKIVNNNGDTIATVKITDGKVASGDKGYTTGGTVYNSIVKNTDYQVDSTGKVTVKTNGNQTAFTISGLGEGSSIVTGNADEGWVDLSWNTANDGNRGANSAAYGKDASAVGESAVAFGYQASASGMNSVALGAGSVAEADNVVSVGGGTVATRKIVNVANGESNSDAATFGQIAKNQTYTVSNNAVTVQTNDGEDAFTIDGLGTEYKAGSHVSISADNKISVLTDGQVAKNNGNIVTGGQVWSKDITNNSSYTLDSKNKSVTVKTNDGNDAFTLNLGDLDGKDYKAGSHVSIANDTISVAADGEVVEDNANIVTGGEVWSKIAAANQTIYATTDSNKNVIYDNSGNALATLSVGTVSKTSDGFVSGKQVWANDIATDTYNVEYKDAGTDADGNKIGVGTVEVKNNKGDVAFTIGNIKTSVSQEEIQELATDYIGDSKTIDVTKSSDKTTAVISVKQGSVAGDSLGVITGDVAYNELRPTDGTYVKGGNTTAQNLAALDSALAGTSIVGDYTITADNSKAVFKTKDGKEAFTLTVDGLDEGTTYEAGSGVSINGNVISADFDGILTAGNAGAEGHYLTKPQSVIKDLETLDANLYDSDKKAHWSGATVAETATNSIALGEGASVGENSTNSIAIGTGATVVGNGSGVFGDPSKVVGDGSYSVGNNNSITADNTFVLGNNVTTTVANAVILGAGSAADRENVVSVGSVGGERQIINVAAGTKNTDAANYGQIVSKNTYSPDSKGVVTVKTNSGEDAFYIDGIGDGTYEGVTYTGSDTVNIDGDRKISVNVNGEIAEDNTGLVTGGDIYSALGGLDSTATYKAISADKNISENLAALDKALSEAGISGGNTTGDGSTATGSDNKVDGEGSSATGDKNTVNGDGSTATGTGNTVNGGTGSGSGSTGGSTATGNNNIIGTEEKGVGGSTATGNENEIYSDGSTATGDKNIINQGATGSNATGTGNAIGGKTSDEGNGSGSSATGNNNTIYSDNSTAIGDNNVLNKDAEGSTAIGNGNTVDGKGSIAEGLNNTVTGNGSVADGSGNVVSGDGSGAYGTNNTIRGNDTYALGSDITSTAKNSVILGAGSTADRDNVVSVGSAGNERQIINVAAGTQNTDAANFGQLVKIKDYTASNGTVTLETNAGTKFKISGLGTGTGATYEAGDNIDITDNKISAVTGDIASGETGLVTGDAVYSKLGEVSSTGSYKAISATNTVAENLAALDKALSEAGISGGNTTGDGSTATGSGNTVDGEGSSATGDKNTVNGDGSTATGTGNTVNGGTDSGSGSTGGSTATGNNNIIGTEEKGVGGSTATGNENEIYSDGSTAVGDKNVIKEDAEGSTAIGTGNTVSGAGSLADGIDNTVSGAGSVAGGIGNDVSGAGSGAYGSNNTVTGDGTYVLGSDIETAAKNSVILGAGSTAKSADYEAERDNVVSVGSVGGERQIINVAAGTKNTDAANVGQLIAKNTYSPDSKGVVTIKTNSGEDAFYIDGIGDGTYEGVTYTGSDTISIDADRKISVNTKGEIAKDNAGIVTGGTIYDAMAELEKKIEQSAGSTYEAGENIEIKDNTISAKVGDVTKSDSEGLASAKDVYDAMANLKKDIADNIDAGTLPGTNTVEGKDSSAVGKENQINGEGSTATGNENKIYSDGSTATGDKNVINNGATGSNATGMNNVIGGDEGTGKGSSATGNDNKVTGEGSAAIGDKNTISGNGSSASGMNNTVSGKDSAASGIGNTVSGDGSGASGSNNTVYGGDSYAIGKNNSIGKEGDSTVGKNTYAIGDNIATTANNAVVLGSGSTATRDNVVSVGSEGAERQIINVAPGVAGTDAVNVNQLNSMRSEMSQEAKDAGAVGAALAGLHPLDYDPENKVDFAVASGTYRGQTAFALGAFFRPTKDVMFSVGSTLGNTDTAWNVGASFKIGRRSAMSGLGTNELSGQVNRLAQYNTQIVERMNALNTENQRLKDAVNMILQRMEMYENVQKSMTQK